MDARRDAPVFAEGEIQIRADVQVVWDLMARIDDWPRWNPDIKSARLEGPLAEGSRFTWRSGPGTITSTLRSVRSRQEIGWSGRSLGITALHVWRLDSTPGGTVVRTEESWEGLPARLLRGWSHRTVKSAIDSGLRHLKGAAEAPTGS